MNFVGAVLALISLSAFTPGKIGVVCLDNNSYAWLLHSCCSFPSISDYANLQLCGAYYLEGPTSMPYRVPSNKTCAVECFFNRTQILVNGLIDSTIALESLFENVDDIWKPLLKNAFDICGTKAAALEAKLQTAKAENSQNCHPLSEFTMTCLYSEMFKFCPDNVFKISYECNHLKTDVLEDSLLNVYSTNKKATTTRKTYDPVKYLLMKNYEFSSFYF